MGWIGNVVLLYSWWGIGKKWRHAIWVGALGSGIWAIKGITCQMWDLVFIEVVLASFQMLAWWRWGSVHKETHPRSEAENL